MSHGPLRRRRPRASRRASIALGLVVALSAPAFLGAQQSESTRAARAERVAADTTRPAKGTSTAARAALARADAAYEDGDRDGARALYDEAFRLDPSLSRAAFRLGALERSPERALGWYRRYQALEPSDPWGMMAEGDLQGRLGRYDAALAAYARAAALAPDERDVTMGRARLHERAGRPNEAADALSRWTARHPDDAEAWDGLGRARLRAGRPQAAAHAFERARQNGTVRGVESRLAAARAQAAPAIEPIVGYMRDSDGNRTARLGGVADVMVSDGARLGAGGEHVSIGDGFLTSRGVNGYARVTARPSPGVRVDVQGGALRLASPATTGTDWTTAQGDLRLRLRPPGGGASLELRGQRMALGMSPLLVENRVVRTEGRATAELPLGPVRLRGIGRLGQLSALGEASNARVSGEGALVVPLGGGRVQLAGQYRTMGFQRASAAGYFAPRRAETVDAGAYFELGEEGPFSLAADLGAGAQRVAEQGANVGKWTRALRGWGYAAYALGPARSLYAEAEAYDAPFAPEGVTTVGNWRFVSINAGVRWALR